MALIEGVRREGFGWVGSDWKPLISRKVTALGRPGFESGPGLYT